MLSRFVGGVVISFAYIHTKNLLSPILIHSWWNLVVLIRTFPSNYSSLIDDISFFMLIYRILLIINIASIIYFIWMIIARFTHRRTVWSDLDINFIHPPNSRRYYINILGLITLTTIWIIILNNLFDLIENFEQKLVFQIIFQVIILLISMIIPILIKVKQRKMQSMFL